MALRSPTSSSSFSCAFKYDVFLSFRGSDTRYGFTGYLYKALSDKGIHAFFDDKELKGGDEIKPSLVEAIKECRIAIPVFSENYASSSFCLDELVTIMECLKAEGRLVLPVFYGVDPSRVRHQTESYGEAIAKHVERFQNKKEKYTDHMERLQKWKMALTQAADLSGKHFILGNGYEHEFIGKIVKEVSDKINRNPLHVADYPVGLESRILPVKSLLDVGSDDGVLMVGIHGIGRMGKTTLARAIYNLIADQFEDLCFLHNVRELSAKHGLAYLQEMLLSKTIGLNIEIGDVNEGIPTIKRRLYRKKVLLVLDDVDVLEQLQGLAGGLDWFGSGSKVIITTRDKHLLASHGIERTYVVDGLNDKEALELLRWKAFKNSRVGSSYKDILNRAITYASGLPLALEVVGSNLFGKNIEECQSMLDRYESIPDKDIHKILKVSFDALEDDAQSVFLDISCCFKGYGLAELENILHAHHGQCLKYHIRVLIEKSLVNICHRGYVTLHDLIEDMGKEIVRQESPEEPGKRSRLWFHKDIVQVLEENMGTNEIKIIYQDCPVAIKWNGKAFKKMKNLRTIIVKRGYFSEGPKYLPSSLRILEWKRYPSQRIPSNFHPKNLAICKLPNSCLKSYGLASLLDKEFVNLKVLNFNRCKYLKYIPDVSGLNLEKISFESCHNLTTIHNSIGFLNNLKILNANFCTKLRSFPPLNLTSLEELELSNCYRLKNFPEILGEMKYITDISLWKTSIKELPFSFQNLTGLKSLLIVGQGMFTSPSNILMMPRLLVSFARHFCLLPKQNDNLSSTVPSNLRQLYLSKCNLSDEFLTVVLSWFAKVTTLDLSGSNFTTLPECLRECCSLYTLRLNDCKCLQEIRGIPPNLKHLDASGCKSLTSSSRSLLLNQELHEAGDTDFCLPGSVRIPLWFEHQSTGMSISFWFRYNIPAAALIFVRESVDDECPNSVFHSLDVILTINSKMQRMKLDIHPIDGIKPDHTYLRDLNLHDRRLNSKLHKSLLIGDWIHAEVTFALRSKIPAPGWIIKQSGIHVFKTSYCSMEDIQFTSPFKERKIHDSSDRSQSHPLVKKALIRARARLRQQQMD